jgi:hypothetical protein
MTNNKGYVQASEVAKKFDISSHTIRRRILEGKIFPGAKKVQMGFGEIWLIPKAIAESVSLKDISPKIYQDRYENKMTSSDKGSVDISSPQSVKIKELEERIGVLERLVLKLVA